MQLLHLLINLLIMESSDASILEIIELNIVVLKRHELGIEFRNVFKVQENEMVPAI